MNTDRTHGVAGPMHRFELFRFVILAYVIGFVFQIGFAVHPNQMFWLALAMFSPTLAVLLSGPNARRSARDSIMGLDLKLLPIALVLGTIPYIAAQLILWPTGLGKLDSTVKIGHMTAVLLLGPFPSSMFALWEEVGWRGYLQPELEKRFSPAIVYLLVGVTWAFWHLPANLAGYNGIEHRALNSFLIFPAEVISMTFVFGWLRSISKTIWPCVFLHGTINSISNHWFIKPNSESIEKVAGLIAWFIFGIIIYLIFIKTKKKSSAVTTIIVR